jgi:endo-alpha-1,4-polygalactosaminidase (GH114 family)
VNRKFLTALLMTAGLTAFAANAQQDQRPRQPPPGVNLEGGEAEEEPLEPEEIPELKPQDDITSIKPVAPELPDRTRELLGDTTLMLDIPLNQIPNYRDEMRKIVEELASYARARTPGFTIVTSGGFDLFTWGQREVDLAQLKRPEDAKPSTFTDSELPTGFPMRRYQQRVNGFILDGFYCAPIRVPLADVEKMRNDALKALSIDHCPPERAQLAFDMARKDKIVAHVDTDMGKTFANIPTTRPNPENPASVLNLTDARSMLVNLNNRKFGSKQNWLQALKNTNHDILVVDSFYNGNQALTKAEVDSLKYKKLGARRMVLAWIEISQASDDAYYWQREWQVGNPSWLTSLDRLNPGKYHVEYWNPAWKAIIGKTFAGLVDLGFDGIVISGVEGYRRWEFMTPIN